MNLYQTKTDSKLRKLFTAFKKSKIFIMVLLILVPAVYLTLQKVQGGNFQFIQSDWITGADTVSTANHTDNQSNWSKFFSKGSKIKTDTTGEAKLEVTPSTFTQTSDADFTTGTKTNVSVANNEIKLLKPNGATCSSASDCQNNGCVSNLCTYATCNLPWGGTINSGQNVTAYLASSVACGSSCTSQVRTCTNGVLSGTYTNQNCSVATCASCNLPWGGSIAHGQSVTAWAASNSGWCGVCYSQARICNNGSLSGTYTYQSCITDACGTCFVSKTKVTMSDGTLKNIEDVLIGEKVIGQNGSINTVIAYERPIIGTRSTYIINNKVEFTGDHPFLSADGGWKVVDLDLFNAHPRNLGSEPTQLKIGDILITDQGPIEVFSIQENQTRPDEETVYDIVLDGDHTYTSNGFIVHNCI